MAVSVDAHPPARVAPCGEDYAPARRSNGAGAASSLGTIDAFPAQQTAGAAGDSSPFYASKPRKRAVASWSFFLFVGGIRRPRPCGEGSGGSGAWPG